MSIRSALSATLAAAAIAALVVSGAATPAAGPPDDPKVATPTTRVGGGGAAAQRTPPVLLTPQTNGLLTAGTRRLRGERVRLSVHQRPPRLTRAQRAFLRRKFSTINPPAPANPEDPVPPPADAPLAEAPTSADLSARTSAGEHGHDSFVELRDRSVINGTQSNTAQTNIVSEPSVANDRDAVLVVGNHFASVSDDNGLSFRYLNPFTTFKPDGDTTTPGSFAGDQVALAADRGSYSLVFWLLQGGDNGNESAVRLVVFRGRSELLLAGRSTTEPCSYVFRPSDFGLGDKRKLDFPQMATTDRFLYVTINEVKIRKSGSGRTKNAVVWRMELDDLDSASCDADIDRSWVETTKKTLAPVQGAGSTMYLAAHHWELLSGDMLRIYSVADGSSTLSKVDRNITNYPDFAKTQDCELTVGGGGNPCARKGDARITTGVRQGGTMAWLWTSAQGQGYPYPHVRTATFSTPSLSLLDESQVWNEEHAWVHPAAAVNSRGEVGVVLYRMGGAQLPEARAYVMPNAIGLRPDHTNSLRVSPNGVAEDQWGDYTTVRAHGDCPSSFLSPVQTMTNGRTDDDVEVRAIIFGSEGDGCADLAVTDVGWSGDAALRAGERVTATPITQNVGTAEVTRHSRTAAYLSIDKTLSDDDRQLSPTHFVDDLGPTESTKKTLDMRIPLGTPLGAYHLLACADHKEKLAEITQANNCWASPSASVQVLAGRGGFEQLIDVDLQDLDVTQSAASAGTAITVEARIRGREVDPDRLSSSRVRYSLTPDPLSDEEIALRSSLLGTGASTRADGPRRTLTAQLRLPRRIGRGLWYVRACVRHPDRTVDQRRFNDCRTGARPIRIR